MINLLLLLIQLQVSTDYKDKDYTVFFDRIDNMVEITVNDSLVFSSGLIDNNPDLDGGWEFYLGNCLTDGKDEVVIQLYNGYPPYEEQNDKHWEIQYYIMKGDQEFDQLWDYDDDNKIGIVFKEKYYL